MVPAAVVVVDGDSYCRCGSILGLVLTRPIPKVTINRSWLPLTSDAERNDQHYSLSPPGDEKASENICTLSVFILFCIAGIIRVPILKRLRMTSEQRLEITSQKFLRSPNR